MNINFKLMLVTTIHALMLVLVSQTVMVILVCVPHATLVPIVNHLPTHARIAHVSTVEFVAATDAAVTLANAKMVTLEPIAKHVIYFELHFHFSIIFKLK